MIRQTLNMYITHYALPLGNGGEEPASIFLLPSTKY